ncbi:hypothetical protein C8Q80DRAFT_106265 [Daedaleopsis nitida]|nr:hypothetical protein C8Q80DRAFT_106265 [Daedaleopsis nitida]
MRYFSLFSVPFVATLASATVLPKREIWQSPYSGQIVAPPSDGTIVGGVDFAFNYAPSEWCEDAFEVFTVYLTEGDVPPPFTDVTEDGALVKGSYEHVFGKFVVSHFGLPLPTGSVLPPSTLSLPTDVAQQLNTSTQDYLTVLQEFNGCPGHIVLEYSLTSIPVTVVSA